MGWRSNPQMLGTKSLLQKKRLFFKLNSKQKFRFLISNDEGECSLTIREAEPHDSGRYTCKIEEFGKPGDNETNCDVTVGGIFAIQQHPLFVQG